MTLVRACMIAQGEDIHVAVFPGAFELHTGPQLEEPEQAGGFWGHFEVRAHALEAGAFVAILERPEPGDYTLLVANWAPPQWLEQHWPWLDSRLPWFLRQSSPVDVVIRRAGWIRGE